MTDRYIIRWPSDGFPNPLRSGRREYPWLEDTKVGQAVFTDGGEPEDQTLCRDLGDLVSELNMLADKLVEAENMAASRYQQIEELKCQVVRQKAQADAYLMDLRVVQRQYDAFRVQVKEQK